MMMMQPRCKLALVHQWLLSHVTRSHSFIDLSESEHDWCPFRGAIHRLVSPIVSDESNDGCVYRAAFHQTTYTLASNWSECSR